MFTFVLSKDKKPLSPCHPARARKLLSKGRASVYKRYPLPERRGFQERILMNNLK